MEILFFLVPLSIILLTAGVIIFRWAVKSGQYDDLDSPAHRILYDDDDELIPPSARTSTAEKNQVDKS